MMHCDRNHARCKLSNINITLYIYLKYHLALVMCLKFRISSNLSSLDFHLKLIFDSAECSHQIPGFRIRFEISSTGRSSNNVTNYLLSKQLLFGEEKCDL